jgi:hypothetical protein
MLAIGGGTGLAASAAAAHGQLVNVVFHHLSLVGPGTFRSTTWLKRPLSVSLCDFHCASSLTASNEKFFWLKKMNLHCCNRWCFKFQHHLSKFKVHSNSQYNRLESCFGIIINSSSGA